MGVNEKTGVGSLQDRQVIEGKDLRPCHIEYPLPNASAATSTSCSLRTRGCRKSWRTSPASARSCLLADREGLTAYLRFPAGHHHRIRHSNFIERTFGETRRRTKVIGRLPGETSCLTLVWAVLDRASRGWRGLTMTSDGLRLLHDLRRSLLQSPTQLQPRTVAASQPDDAPQN